MRISTGVIYYPIACSIIAILCIFIIAVYLIFFPVILYQELRDPAAHRRRRQLWKDLKNKKNGGPHEEI